MSPDLNRDEQLAFAAHHQQSETLIPFVHQGAKLFNTGDRCSIHGQDNVAGLPFSIALTKASCGLAEPNESASS